MKPEDKELLLKDLSARLPYDVIVSVKDIDNFQFDGILQVIGKNWCRLNILDPIKKAKVKNQTIPLNHIYIKPYLRPMSSMTEEEAREIAILHGNEPVDILSIKVTDEYIDIILDDGVCGTITSSIRYDEIISSLECFDYLNKKMFDFRGLIPKDLALSTETFNPYIKD